MDKQFLSELRGQSCYPAFRGYVGFATFVGYLASLGIALLSVLAGTNTGRVSVVLVGCCIAVVIGIVVAIAREVSLMVADIADASVFTASKHGESSPQSAAPHGSYMSHQDLAALARGKE